MSQSIKFKIRTKDRSAIQDFELPIIPIDDPMFDQFKAIDLIADLQGIYQSYSKISIIEKTIQEEVKKNYKELLKDNTPEQIEIYKQGIMPNTLKRDVEFYKSIVTNVLQPAFPDLDWTDPTIPFAEIGKTYFHEYLPNFEIFLTNSLSESKKKPNRVKSKKKSVK